MTWLAVDGVRVPLEVEGSASERSYVEVGQRRRAIDGTIRSNVYTRKKEWDFRTALIPTGLRDRLLAKLTDDGAMPLTCEGEVFGDSGSGSPAFSRSSTARYTDSHGVLQEASSGVLRDKHWVENADGVLVPSYLLEASRDNDLTQSGDLTHGDWTSTGLSGRNADQASDPEGGTTLDELVESSATSGHFVSQTQTLTADANYALSCFGIANDRNWLLLQVVNGSDFSWAWFNLSTGAVGTTGDGGSGTFARAYVEDWTDVASGLYRCVLAGSVGGGSTSITGRVRLADADGSSSYAGDGSSSMYVGYAQLEDSAQVASSYIPTTTSSVTRNADSLYLDHTADPQAMTVYVKFVERGTVLEANGDRLFHIGAAGAGTDPRFLVRDSGGNYRVEHDNGTTTSGATLSASPSFGEATEIRAVLHSDGHVTIGQSIDGASETTAADVTTATLGAAWAGERLYLNSGGSSNVGLNAFIGLPKIASGVRSMEDMRSLETPDLFPGLPIGSEDCYAEIERVRPVQTVDGIRWRCRFRLMES